MGQLRSWTGLAACLVLAACAQPPLVIPPQRANPLPPPAPAVSTFAMPIRFGTGALARALDGGIHISDSVFQANIPLTQVPTKPTLHLAVDKAGPIQATPIANGIAYGLPLTLDGWIGWTGQSRPLAEVSGGTDLLLSTTIAIDRDWRLSGQVVPSVQQTAPFVLAIPWLGYRHDIQDTLASPLNALLQYGADKASAAVGQVDLKTPLAKAWAASGKPVRLSQDPPVWLVIAPTAIYSGALTADGTALVITPSLSGVVLLSVSDEAPATGAPTDLPPNDPPPAGALPGVTIAVTAEATYAALNAQLAGKLVGQGFSFPGGRKLTVTRAELYGDGGKLALILGFQAGGLTGQLIVEGQPTYDSAAHTLSVAGFDYQTATSSALANAAAWLIHKPFTDWLAAHMVLDVSGPVTAAETFATDHLKAVQIAPGVVFNVQDPRLTTAPPYVGDKAVILMLAASVKASLDIDAPPPDAPAPEPAP